MDEDSQPISSPLIGGEKKIYKLKKKNTLTNSNHDTFENIIEEKNKELNNYYINRPLPSISFEKDIIEFSDKISKNMNNAINVNNNSSETISQFTFSPSTTYFSSQIDKIENRLEQSYAYKQPPIDLIKKLYPNLNSNGMNQMNQMLQLNQSNTLEYHLNDPNQNNKSTLINHHDSQINKINKDNITNLNLYSSIIPSTSTIASNQLTCSPISQTLNASIPQSIAQSIETLLNDNKSSLVIDTRLDTLNNTSSNSNTINSSSSVTCSSISSPIKRSMLKEAMSYLKSIGKSNGNSSSCANSNEIYNMNENYKHRNEESTCPFINPTYFSSPLSTPFPKKLLSPNPNSENQLNANKNENEKYVNEMNELILKKNEYVEKNNLRNLSSPIVNKNLTLNQPNNYIDYSLLLGASPSPIFLIKKEEEKEDFPIQHTNNLVSSNSYSIGSPTPNSSSLIGNSLTINITNNNNFNINNNISLNITKKIFFEYINSFLLLNKQTKQSSKENENENGLIYNINLINKFINLEYNRVFNSNLKKFKTFINKFHSHFLLTNKIITHFNIQFDLNSSYIIYHNHHSKSNPLSMYEYFYKFNEILAINSLKLNSFILIKNEFYYQALILLLYELLDLNNKIYGCIFYYIKNNCVDDDSYLYSFYENYSEEEFQKTEFNKKYSIIDNKVFSDDLVMEKLSSILLKNEIDLKDPLFYFTTNIVLNLLDKYTNSNKEIYLKENNINEGIKINSAKLYLEKEYFILLMQYHSLHNENQNNSPFKKTIAFTKQNSFSYYLHNYLSNSILPRYYLAYTLFYLNKFNEAYTLIKDTMFIFGLLNFIEENNKIPSFIYNINILKCNGYLLQAVCLIHLTRILEAEELIIKSLKIIEMVCSTSY